MTTAAPYRPLPLSLVEQLRVAELQAWLGCPSEPLQPPTILTDTGDTIQVCPGLGRGCGYWIVTGRLLCLRCAARKRRRERLGLATA